MVNWFAIPTVFFGFGAFHLGRVWARKTRSVSGKLVSWVTVLLLALPALAYAAYYSKLLGEPLWLYSLRSFPGSELFAAGAGFAAGWAQEQVVPQLKLSRVGKGFLIPLVLGFVITIPYLKPLLRPLQIDTLQDRWQDGVCLQSSASTCGPASAATILRQLGIDVTERELARESFSCSSGTENWYLARALRRKNVLATFYFNQALEQKFPAIAGVKLKNSDNAGHFIAILGKEGDKLVIADPLSGKRTNTFGELQAEYSFTGFSLLVQRE